MFGFNRFNINNYLDIRFCSNIAFSFSDTNTMTTISWRIPKSLFMSFSPFSLSGNFFETRSLWKSLKSSHLSDHCSSDTNLVFQVITWNLWWIQIQQVLLVRYLVYLPFFNFSNRRVCYCSTSILHISLNQINTIFSGAATIRLEMPSHMQNSLIFHYNRIL